MNNKYIRLQLDLPRDISAKMHEMIRIMRNKNGELRSKAELNREERMELQSLLSAAAIRPELAGRVQEKMMELRLIEDPQVTAMGRRYRIPTLGAALIKTIEKYTPEQLFQMMKDYIAWEDDY